MDVKLCPGQEPFNTGAQWPPVIILCALSFSPDFDRGTYRLSMNHPYVTVYKSKEKFRAHKIVTGGPSAAGLFARWSSVVYFNY